MYDNKVVVCNNKSCSLSSDNITDLILHLKLYRKVAAADWMNYKFSITGEQFVKKSCQDLSRC